MSNASAPLIEAGEIRDQTRSFLADSALWLQAHWLHILFATAIAIGIVVVLHLVRRWGVKACRRADGTGGWGSIIGRAVAKTGNFFIVMTAARLVISYARAPLPIAQTVGFLFTVAAVFQAAIWVREFIFGAVERRTRVDEDGTEALASAVGLIRVLVTIALFAIASIVVLSNVGVNVTGLIAGLGVGGIAIGLAAQGIFADLFAALAIIFDKPFRRGDVIAYDSSSGTVEAIGLKSTRIRGPGGEERIVANKKLLDFEIQNNSNRVKRRVKFVLALIYQTPPDRLARVPVMLREIVESEKLVFIRAAFVNFSANSLDFELEFDSPSPDFSVADGARHRVGIAIVRRFAEEGIEFFAPARPALPPKES